MRPLILSTILCLTPLVYASPLAIEKRACSSDNLLRALKDARYTSQAGVFCSAYINLPSVTSVLYNTASTISTSTMTTTIPVSPIIIESTQTITATQYTQDISNNKHKRVVPYPTFIAATYAPSQVSSACSCIATNIALHTTSVTSTVATVTSIVTTVATFTPVPTTSTIIEVDTTTVYIPRCGVQFTSWRPKYIISNYQGTLPGFDAAACYTLYCANDASCQSLRYYTIASLPNTGICYTMQNTVTDDFVVGSNNPADLVYDIGCFSN